MNRAVVGLFRCPHRAGRRAHVLHLVEVLGVGGGGQRGRRTRPELAGRIEQQRLQLRHPRVEERRERGRGRAPDAGRGRDVERDRRVAAVVLAELDEPVGRALAVPDALVLRRTVGNLGERRRQRGVQPALRRREVLEQHVVRGDRGGRLRRRPPWTTTVPVVELVLPGDADDGVVDGSLLEREPHERFRVQLSGVDDDRVERNRVPVADRPADRRRLGAGNPTPRHCRRC